LTLGNTVSLFGNVSIMLVISVPGEQIVTSEMCLGAHISRGNIYHCNTGSYFVRSSCVMRYFENDSSRVWCSVKALRTVTRMDGQRDRGTRM